MSTSSWGLLTLYLGLLLVAAWPLGIWLARLCAGTLPSWMQRVEVPVFRLAGTSAEKSMNWSQYALALLAFNPLGVFGLCAATLAGVAAAQSCGHGGRLTRLVFQHRNQLCNQHQLAGLHR